MAIRPLPPQSSHGGGYILRPGIAGCLILATPVPPHAEQLFSLIAGFILLTMLFIGSYRSPGPQLDGGSLAEIFVARSATRWLRSCG